MRATNLSDQRSVGFAGRTAVLATMHGKEAAIAPAFREVLGVELMCPAEIDTDSLGTFTGEVERPGDMLATIRRKAQLGLDLTQGALAIASEGAYGAHPVYHFLPSGVEMMIFIDASTGIEVIETIEVTATNFGITDITDSAPNGAFLDRIGFPEHGLVVEPNDYRGDRTPIIKGITSQLELDKAIAESSRRSADGLAKLHADMRAHVNPTRMTQIESLAKKLAERLTRLCPACGMPGFGVTRHQAGLPCEACNSPTRVVLFEVHTCASCNVEDRRARSDGLAAARAEFCDFCNP